MSKKLQIILAVHKGSRATHQADKQINNLMSSDNMDKVEKLIKVADSLGVSLSVMALAWTLRKPEISSFITGASNAYQLESNLAASGFEIPADAITEIEKILNYIPFNRSIG